VLEHYGFSGHGTVTGRAVFARCHYPEEKQLTVCAQFVIYTIFTIYTRPPSVQACRAEYAVSALLHSITTSLSLEWS
jgi:hypothetical protein